MALKQMPRHILREGAQLRASLQYRRDPDSGSLVPVLLVDVEADTDVDGVRLEMRGLQVTSQRRTSFVGWLEQVLTEAATAEGVTVVDGG